MVLKEITRLSKKYNLPVISTGYFLLGTESKTSVEKISETVPLDPLDFDNVLNHVLVAQYFGMNLIYLENGSGAGNPVNCDLIEFLSKNIEIPMIIGGGIQNKDDIINIKKAGARFVVLGTILEENLDSVFISKLLS